VDFTTTKQNKNLKYPKQTEKYHSVIQNLPTLIKEVEGTVLESNKNDISEKYKKKKYIGKDKSGYYIM
jgi:hypothetical protein